jgi:Rrf2 family protein
MSGASNSFAVALHALAILALRKELTSSDVLATSINTNPVVVRRVMAKLVKAGLVASTAGKHGGFRLERPARMVKLVDVHRALDEGGAFRIPPYSVNPACKISCNMKGTLTELLGRVDGAVEKELGKTTLADVVASVSVS